MLRPHAVSLRADSGDSNQNADVDGEFCETDRLHAVLETKTASSLVAGTDQLHAESESTAAPSFAAVSCTRSRRAVVHVPVGILVVTLLGVAELVATSAKQVGRFCCGSFVVISPCDHIHTQGVGCAHGAHDLHDARSNSCLGTHAARVNSFVLHSARGNSGGHADSYRCTYNSCGGVREGTKPLSMSTRCQVGCPSVEKLASLQQPPGRLHVETWAGRHANPSLPIPQVVEIMPGCADMVTRLFPPFFSSVSPGLGGQVGH